MVCSTQGDGVPPTESREFCDWVFAQGAGALPNLHYSVLALGDRSYQHFCRCGKQLDAALAAAGGREVAARVDIDKEDWGAIDAWMEGVRAALPSLGLRSISETGVGAGGSSCCSMRVLMGGGAGSAAGEGGGAAGLLGAAVCWERSRCSGVTHPNRCYSRPNCPPHHHTHIRTPQSCCTQQVLRRLLPRVRPSATPSRAPTLPQCAPCRACAPYLTGALTRTP